jgi:hypothetical protein
MSTVNHILFSLEKMFLSNNNIINMSAHIGRPMKNEMIKWAKQNPLDDYESVQGDYTESLDYVNDEFSKMYKDRSVEINTSAGQKYPKYYISDGVEKYTTDDFRKHDAKKLQDVRVSNSNFRYNNKIKSWRLSQHRHYYDKDEHANGLRDIRELNTPVSGYNMDKIYGKNPYESSDSLMYNY